MEMWAKTKSSAARVSQLADIQDKPVKQNLKNKIIRVYYFKKYNFFKFMFSSVKSFVDSTYW